MLCDKRFRTLLLLLTVLPVLQFWLSVSASQSSDVEPRPVSLSTADPVNLKGIITLYDGPAPDQLVGKLVSVALQRDEANAALLAKEKQMKGRAHAVLEKAKMSLQYVAEYRGFEMSSEAADIILDEKLRLKSKSSTDYASQRKADEVHAKVFSSLLQIAQGLGTSDPLSREKTIAAGMNPLKALVGEDLANSAFKTLSAWSEQINVPASLFEHRPWTMMELQQKSEDLVKESALTDPVMGLVRRTLHKYNQHSKLTLGAAKVINTSLSLAQLCPSFVAPAASILQYVYQMSTGGPEDFKLLTELYLDRRLDCRWKRLNQEATLSVNAYNNAVMTANPVLLSLSESFITALGGEEASSRIIGVHRLVARQSTHSDSIDCLLTHTSM